MARPGKQVKGVRPTTSKVLESLLAILEPDLPDLRAVDLFAGTGQVGLGFLERGAQSVLFIEGNPGVASSLKKRLKKEAGSDDEWSVCIGKIPQVLQTLKGPFDLFWADPPYDWSFSSALLEGVAPHAAPGAILAVEHHHKTVYEGKDGWNPYRVKKFGETRLSFFRFDPIPTC